MLIRILLYPFALLYGIVVSLRFWLYHTQILRSISFDIPVISVGNLSAGGTGKTPHIEYMIRLLRQYLPVGVLSRGYKRKTTGFQLVQTQDSALASGDEPLLIKKKYPDIAVAVGESRIEAIPQLLSRHPELKTLLLDDAYQHLALKPGLSILLTEYGAPFTKDHLMPAGRLREWRSGYKRADIIIVTKCPPVLDDATRTKMLNEIQPQPHQQVYFSYYQYGTPYALFQSGVSLEQMGDTDIFLVCGIARTDYLTDYLAEKAHSLKYLEFGDHHFFSNHDIARISAIYKNIESDRKVILTTEKDAVRLLAHRKYLLHHQIPLFVQPIQVAFHGGDGERFDEDIRQFLLQFKV